MTQGQQMKWTIVNGAWAQVAVVAQRVGQGWVERAVATDRRAARWTSIRKWNAR